MALCNCNMKEITITQETGTLKLITLQLELHTYCPNTMMFQPFEIAVDENK